MKAQNLKARPTPRVSKTCASCESHTEPRKGSHFKALINPIINEQSQGQRGNEQDQVGQGTPSFVTRRISFIVRCGYLMEAVDYSRTACSQRLVAKREVFIGYFVSSPVCCTTPGRCGSGNLHNMLQVLNKERFNEPCWAEPRISQKT